MDSPQLDRRRKLMTGLSGLDDLRAVITSEIERLDKYIGEGRHRCSFCQGWHHQQDFVVHGPGVSICSTCLDDAVELRIQSDNQRRPVLTEEIPE